METIIAVAILAVIGTSLLTALETNAKATRQLDEKVVATNLATAYLEAIKASPYDVTEPYYDDAVADITVPFQYTVSVDIDFSSDGTTWVAYDIENHQNIQKIAVTVSREGGKHILTICTFKTERVVPES
ncbi:hypothetical protein ES703_83409 [subsurface metagenome]